MANLAEMEKKGIIGRGVTEGIIDSFSKLLKKDYGSKKAEVVEHLSEIVKNPKGFFALWAEIPFLITKTKDRKYKMEFLKRDKYLDFKKYFEKLSCVFKIQLEFDDRGKAIISPYSFEFLRNLLVSDKRCPYYPQYISNQKDAVKERFDYLARMYEEVLDTKDNKTVRNKKR